MGERVHLDNALMVSHISCFKFEFFAHQVDNRLGSAVRNFKSHGTTKPTTTQLYFDCGKKIFGIFVIKRKICVACNTKNKTLLNRHPLK